MPKVEIQKKEELRKGTKLKQRYIIEKVIGRGGFGITYCAFDLLLNCLVAIKELYVEDVMTRDAGKDTHIILSEKEESQKRIEKCYRNFRREIVIMKELQNVPYISRIRDDFEENGTVYLVMNLLKGQSLQAYKEGKNHKNGEWMHSIEHILIALEEMHQLGYIHRDISPGNLFLTEDGDLYLIDFGTATSLGENEEFVNENCFVHKGFQAPEFKDVKRQGTWTDLYSLCATVFYLFTNEGVPEPANRQMYDVVPQLLAKSKLSNRQQNTLLKGLNIAIENRFQDASELRLALCKEVNTFHNSEKVTFCASTDIGDRKINQDNMFVDGLFYYEGTDFTRSGEILLKEGALHMVSVSDGVSNAVAGELASRAVSQAMNHFLEQYRTSEILPERLIDELLNQVNEKIITLGKKMGKTGATLSFLLWDDEQYYAVNIGDSPIFLLRKNKLVRLSTPHTLAAKKEMEGKDITIKDLHTLVNFLGKESVAGSDMAAVRHGYLKRGDVFFICTDGITDKINLDRLKWIMKRPIEKGMSMIRRLLKNSRDNDNNTAIILKF